MVIRKETGWKRKFTSSSTGYTTPVGETGILVLNQDGSFTYTERDGTKELFDLKGRLSSITGPKGSSLVFTYGAPTRFSLFGLLPWNINQSVPLEVARDYRLSSIEEYNAAASPTGVRVDFQYDSTGRLSSLNDSLGRSVNYGHDSIGNLTSVTSTLITATYLYNDATSKHLLTGIDEGDGPYTNTYSTEGKVIKQTHGTGTIDFEYIVSRQNTKVTTTIKDGAGTLLNTNTRNVDFDALGLVTRTVDAFGNETRYIRSGNIWVGRVERWENTGTVVSPAVVLRNAIDYTYDDKGNQLTRTEAAGSSLEKTTSCTYNPTSNLQLTETAPSVVNPAQNRITTNAYDVSGNLTSITETGLLGDSTPYSYITGYTYDANGLLTGIDGPITDVQDITSFINDALGNLVSMTQPLIGTTTYTNYDGLGNPGTITDPNGNSTTLTYDSAGRILTIKAPGDTSPIQIAYTTGGCGSCGGGPSNRIDHIILPEGNRIDFYYDTNGKLSRIADSQGNGITYTYDSEGNRLKEDIKDPSGVIQKTISYQYDALNRLKQIKNPNTTNTEYSYDDLGNSTGYQYDTLNRMTAATQPGSITTGFGYNTNNNMTSVTDANTNTTTYTYDDKGRLYRTISPDTGTTTYGYDPAGNMKTKTDAKGITTNYSYDAANRLASITFPSDPAISYTYDSCPNGKGRLCAITDQSGTANYEYTKKGQIAKETRTIDSIAYVTQYSYDMNGNTKSITYPSGRVITYNYSNGKATSVLNNAATLVSNITYKPFGPIASLTYGNGLNRTITYDTQYHLTNITTGALQNITYGYDTNANITTITNVLDATKNKSYTYDALNRLTNGTGPWGTIGWSYDSVGNRLSQTDGAGTSSYNYQNGSNKLSSISGLTTANFTYDGNGNTTAENSKGFTYNQNQRLVQATATQTGNYVYNAQGQRAKKTANGITTNFIYDQQGHLIFENASDGTQAEYIQLNNQPLAKIDASGTTYIHTDHLGTPTLMTDATAAKVWEIETQPFGDNAVTTGTANLNLRFPGQYADSESGLNYNYFRDYNPQTGRYVEGDPIGLRGGINPFIYVQNNPVNFIDPDGLTRQNITTPEQHPGGQKHVHWGDEPKCRNGGAVNNDGSYRHGDRPPNRIRDLIRNATGWALGNLDSIAPLVILPGQQQMLNNISNGMPLDYTPGTVY